MKNTTSKSHDKKDQTVRKTLSIQKTKPTLSVSEIILEQTVYLQNQMFIPNAPQILLAGRSNVGKSSLLNCLAGRKKLAKTSSVPGKTRSLNFYRVEPYGFYLVDLPGYGYARCSKQERDSWAKLINTYLQKSNSIRLAAALLDCRLSPQQLDQELVAYMHQNHIPLLVILTKSDKSKQADKMKIKNLWANILEKNQPIIFFSSKTGQGKKQFWEQVAQALNILPANKNTPSEASSQKNA